VNHTAAQLASEAIVFDEIFPHRPETIWQTLTTGALMRRWLGMVPSDFTPTPGSRCTYQTTPAGEWDGTIECQVLEAVPNRLFAYSWKGGHPGNTGYGSPLDTVVTFTLEAVEGGTRLRLVHSGFVLPTNETAYRNMSGGWNKVILRIGTVAGESAQ
jgi:uncharacterized protein YndB with AHSA1/START domain